MTIEIELERAEDFQVLLDQSTPRMPNVYVEAGGSYTIFAYPCGVELLWFKIDNDERMEGYKTDKTEKAYQKAVMQLTKELKELNFQVISARVRTRVR